MALKQLMVDTSTGRQVLQDPPGGISDVAAMEAIAAGDLVNVFYDGADYKCRKATNAAWDTRAVAVATTAAAIGEFPQLVQSGELSDSALPAGSLQDAIYLGTAGAKVGTPPTASGTIIQVIGKRCGATKFLLTLEAPYENF